MRMFIAIEMFPKVERILLNFQKEFKDCIQGTFPKRFHLTLKFLADVSEEESIRLKESLSRIDHTKITLELDRMGTFPTTGNPHILWAGLKGDIPSLTLLQTKIETATEWLPSEPNAFIPHVTLARIKEVTDEQRFKDAIRLPMPGFKFDIYRFLLFSSTLTPEGPSYQILEGYDLKV
ncbi:MAG: 2'-5' RNA ligase [Elusimicrobia bacterium RIFOXYB2_FULL_49_7]|nr:MAG: 2'-5' RNA ligase [Elusimicrobia bacterium RIFOXYB2_FULL_49_7]